MKNKLLYEICKLQDIIHLYEKYQDKTRVYCPYCGERKAYIKIENIRDKDNKNSNTNNQKWHCSACEKTGSAFELLRLVEEDYCEEHSMAYWDSRENKGVEL